MYNGNENLINDGEYLQCRVLDYWQWAYSNILQNIQRGNFAEFIVKTALDLGGLAANNGLKNDFSPYDLDGPVIASTGRPSRIEVKSAAFVQIWDIKHPDRASFGIAPAVLPDETGDYPAGAPKQRNNDLYVFTIYTATDRRRNVLDLSYWQFYVLPTHVINADPVLSNQKTISLKRVQELCKTLSFNELYPEILRVCDSIPADSFCERLTTEG